MSGQRRGRQALAEPFEGVGELEEARGVPRQLVLRDAAAGARSGHGPSRALAWTSRKPPPSSPVESEDVVQAWQAGVGGVPAREMDELAKAMGGGASPRAGGPNCGRRRARGSASSRAVPGGGLVLPVAGPPTSAREAGPPRWRRQSPWGQTRDSQSGPSGCRRPRSSGPSSCAAWRAHGAEGGRRPSARPGLESARAHGRQMAGPLRARFPKAAALTDGSGDGVLARRRGRRLPQRGRRLAGAALMGQNGGWMQGKRHMALEAMAEAGGAPELPPALPAWPRTTRPENIYTTLTDATVAPALERREQGGEGTAQRGSSSTQRL